MKPELFAVVSEEKVKGVLGTLYEFVGLPLRLMDGNGEILQYYGEKSSYCSLLQKHFFVHRECDQLHFKAGQRATELGEAYIFTCHADLNHVAFPLVYQGELVGVVVAGPFLMEEPDSTLVYHLLENHALSPELSLELYDRLSVLPIMPPTKVQQFKKLMDYLLSPLLPMERAHLLKTQEKMYQQARINETIQIYKGQSAPASQVFFREKESMLLTKVRTGNVQEAKALLNELLGYVLFSEGSDIDTVRIHAIELTTLLSRIAMDGGAHTNSIYELNKRFLVLMSKEQNIDDLCYLLQDVLESFMDAMFSNQDKGNPYIRKALRYMAEHYNQPLTLAQMADIVGLSQSYFSKLFHEIVGISFREHLCRIRVEESKRLLLSSDYSLTEIAIAVGFADQSHYCKTFKLLIGLTPGQYRNC